MDDHARGASQDEAIMQRIAQLEAMLRLMQERQAGSIGMVARMAEQVEAMDKAAAILAAVQAPAALPRPRRPAAHRGPPRDRHGLHIVPGAAAAALGWALRSRAHKVVASAAGLALAAGTVAAPSVISGPPASASPSPPARVQPHMPRSGTAAVPLVMPSPAARKRRRRRDRPSPDAASATPAPAPDPSPTPTPTLAQPTPLPTLPVPTPTLPVPVPTGSRFPWALTS